MSKRDFVPLAKPAPWRHPRVLCACAAALLAMAAAQAQTAAPSGSAVQEPEQAPAGGREATALSEVVVTARKRSESAQSVPLSIQTFGPKDIDALGIGSSADLGQITPNLEIALPSGAGNQPIVTIRGIGLNDYNTNNSGPNGIYVDQVYLSAPSAQTFQVFDLERIEVLKGPQGTLYGNNSSGGAINFITIKPSDRFAAALRGGYASFDTFRLEGALNGPLAPGLSGRIAFVKNNSGGYVYNAYSGNHENGANDFAARALLLYQPWQQLTLLLNLHGAQVDVRPQEFRHLGAFQPGSSQPCSQARIFSGQCVDLFGYGTPAGFYDGAYNRQQYQKVSNTGASLRVDYLAGAAPDALKLTSISAFEYNSKFLPQDTDASPNRLIETDFGVRSNDLTQELRLAQDVGRLKWVLGVYGLNEWLYQNQSVGLLLDYDKFFGAGAGNGVAQNDSASNRQQSAAYAVFGQTDFAVSEKLTLTLGGRFTRDSKTFDGGASQQFQDGGIDHFGPYNPLYAIRNSFVNTDLSWRAALDYALSRRVMGYASAASGFKSGGFNGGFLSAEPGVAGQQLQAIRPEKVLAYELGIKSQWLDQRLLFNLALFYNDYRDMQVFDLVPSDVQKGFDIQILSNAPTAHTDGIDLQLTARPLSRLTASFSLGLLQARLGEFVSGSQTAAPADYSGNTLPLAPRISLSGTFGYRIPLASGALDLQAAANYRSKQYFDLSNDPLIVQSGYWLENLRAAYAFGGGQWQAAGTVSNLANRKYLSYAFDGSSQFGFVSEFTGVPRSFGLSVSCSY